ncbi:MAG TPA: Mut7-C RNAse domain-containing protein [Thermodesulfovibrionales bacterium]|nr:Mut7-C RNAse domain-containing protein [Thermodesulfovibrionales bacterium]
MSDTSQNQHFIADVMLGRLARWLRLLGFDTVYFPDISDTRLIKVAKEQGRLILTRDTRLIKIKGIKDYLLIRANDSFQQLLEVIHALGLKDFHLLTRCVACNGQLSRFFDKTEIKDSVPDFVFLNIHVFLKCHDCGKVYWEGTHPKMFRDKLAEVLSSNPSFCRGFSS